MADEQEINRLLDQLLEGLSPEEIVGRDGLADQLTKRLLRREAV